MRFLTEHEKNKLHKAIPKGIRRVMKKHSCLCLAGGSIRSILLGEEVKDFDLFPTGNLDIEEIRNDLQLANYEQSAETKRAWTFTPNPLLGAAGLPVQVIVGRRFPDEMEVVHSFDFTCCMASLHFNEKEEWYGIKGEDFDKSNQIKELVFTGASYSPEMSLMRAFKYAKKGYYITPVTVSQILHAMGADTTKWVEFFEENPGSSEHY